MPSGKAGKNEQKRAAADALKDLDSEMTEEERQAMERRGMGGQFGGLQTGQDQLVAKKLTKEEKKAQTEARRVAMAEKKEQMAAMKAAQDAQRKVRRRHRAAAMKAVLPVTARAVLRCRHRRRRPQD